MTGISINKHIISLLKADAQLRTMVNQNNIVSLYINPTTFPFISVMRSSVNPSYCKEGLLEDNVGVQIDVISDDYEETINIAERIRDILENRVFTDETSGTTIDNITLTNVNESYIEDSYVQTLDFNITIH